MKKFKERLGKAVNEFFVLFLSRIYSEIPSCRIAEFSTLKILQSQNFSHFRTFFKAKLDSLFLVPSNTFDNVNGKFPIAFYIWNTGIQDYFKSINADVYDHSGTFLHKKEIATNEEKQFVIRWLQQFYDKENTRIAYLRMIGTDMQHNQGVYITNNLSPNDIVKHLFTTITHKNLFVCVIYVTIRHCITQTWINDRDQFFYPTAEWQNDFTFQCNCLTYMLFHGQNRITSVEGTNHWIPFTEEEVDAKEKFESHFMTNFMAGKLASRQLPMTDYQLPEEKKETLKDLAEERSFVPTEPLIFSPEATAVFDAGRELWRYYHAQPNANPNASYYDIREHFQGRSVPGRGNSATSDQSLRKGRMNSRSEDAEYNRLLGNLKAAMEALRLKIVPKVYEYGFLV